MAAMFVHGIDPPTQTMRGPANGVRVAGPLPSSCGQPMVLCVAAEEAGTYVVRMTARSPSGRTTELPSVEIPVIPGPDGKPIQSTTVPLLVQFPVDVVGLYWFDVELGAQRTRVPLIVLPGDTEIWTTAGPRIQLRR